MRIKFITDQLACGGAINDMGAFNSTLKYGITHIINLDKTCCGADLVETLHYRIKDNGKSRPDRYIISCLVFALEVLKDPNNKLFVHCAAGRRRSTSICYAILRGIGFSKEDAKKIIIEKYFTILENQDKGYRRPKSLIQYESDVERILSYPFIKSLIKFY